MDISNSYEYLELQQMKFDFFKSQNGETGLFDVAFEVEGKILFAHRNMLNLVSPTFATMLSNQEVPIKIQKYKYDDFYEFITYLYCGKCQLSDTSIYSMIDMAEFFGIHLFKIYCDKYAAAMEMTMDNIFKLTELVGKYSMTQLKESVTSFFAINFAAVVKSDVFLTLRKSIVKKFVINYDGKAEPEVVFEAIYKWCEKHGMEKQSADPSLTLNEIIKEEMSEFIPIFNFCFMKHKFLLEFVLPRSFILSSSSLNELSKILYERVSQPLVKVTNRRGEVLYGNVIPDKSVIENIKSLSTTVCRFDVDGPYGWWITMFKIPPTLSPLKKREGIQWYIVYFTTGRIGVVRGSDIDEVHYLLAELTATTLGFDPTDGCKIEIE